MTHESHRGSAESPQVTVVVPAYNAGDQLERCIGSALAQTLESLEVIVVDDASTDDTAAVAEAIDDDRVRVLRRTANGGVSRSRNDALDAARGEWIALLDADDVWAPDRLENLLIFRDAADVISDDFYYFGRRVPVGAELQWRSFLVDLGRRRPREWRLTLDEFVKLDLGLLKPIMRRSFLEEHELRYHPDIRVGEDYLLYLQLLLSGARWIQLPRAYYFYSSSKSSLTGDRLEFLTTMIGSTEIVLRDPLVRANARLTAQMKERHAMWRRVSSFTRYVDAWRMDRPAFWRLVRTDPFQVPVVGVTGVRIVVSGLRAMLRSRLATEISSSDHVELPPPLRQPASVAEHD